MPVSEVVDICATALFEDGLNTSDLNEDGFRQLMKISTTSVEFLFNKNIYCQVDGVAMGSPLGPTLANIFVGYHERKLFSATIRPSTYFRYVDDTFVIFENTTDYQIFFDKLNNLHPSLKFTMESEENNKLPFLDVLVTKDYDRDQYLTAVYRKPTFTGNYIRYESFCHRSRKVSLIKTLTHRALMICSIETLPSELNFLRKMFAENGYPDHLVNKIIRDYCSRPSPFFGPRKCPVYIKLPYIGRASDRFADNIKRCVGNCFKATTVKVLFSSRPNFKGLHKDPLPTHTSSKVIYKFLCYCGSSYVGKSMQTLRKRSKQHVTASILAYAKAINEGTAEHFKTTKKWIYVKNAYEKSSIGKHLIDNILCLKNFNFNQFTILARGRNQFHLDVLESVFISTIKPNICKQTAFCYKVLLF